MTRSGWVLYRCRRKGNNWNLNLVASNGFNFQIALFFWGKQCVNHVCNSAKLYKYWREFWFLISDSDDHWNVLRNSLAIIILFQLFFLDNNFRIYYWTIELKFILITRSFFSSKVQCSIHRHLHYQVPFLDWSTWALNSVKYIIYYIIY